MVKTVIVILLVSILLSQSGCIALALGALAGMAVGEAGNTIDRNRAEEIRRQAEEQRRQREHEAYMQRMRQ